MLTPSHTDTQFQSLYLLTKEEIKGNSMAYDNQMILFTTIIPFNSNVFLREARGVGRRCITTPNEEFKLA